MMDSRWISTCIPMDVSVELTNAILAVEPPITLSDLDLPLSSSEELPTLVSKAAMFLTCPSDPGNGGPRLRQCAPQSLPESHTPLCRRNFEWIVKMSPLKHSLITKLLSSTMPAGLFLCVIDLMVSFLPQLPHLSLVINTSGIRSCRPSVFWHASNRLCKF